MTRRGLSAFYESFSQCSLQGIYGKTAVLFCCAASPAGFGSAVQDQLPELAILDCLLAGENGLTILGKSRFSPASELSFAARAANALQFFPVD
jgi:hypothetical protein